MSGDCNSLSPFDPCNEFILLCFALFVIFWVIPFNMAVRWWEERQLRKEEEKRQKEREQRRKAYETKGRRSQ